MSCLTLNNISNCDFLDIIQSVGHQLSKLDIDNFSDDESDLEIYLDLNLLGQFCPEIKSLSVEMAFVDFKSDKTESSSSIFQKLTELHLKGNKYRDVSVLPSLLADTPSLARLSIQVSVVHLDVEDFSEELLWCLLCHKEPARSKQKAPSRGLFVFQSPE